MASAQDPPQFQPREAHEQYRAHGVGGAAAAGVAVLALALAGGAIAAGSTGGIPALTAVGALLALLALFACRGFVVVQPNESRVLILFGRYVGTLLEAGLWWVNPFTVFWRQTISLRALHAELQQRLQTAGIEVLETRLTHLAYASEIAEVMLRRQQAEAIVAARRTMVAGAVGLVEMALQELGEKDVIELDSERKAAMVSNLMVVLSGDRAPSPVINTGSLYT